MTPDPLTKDTALKALASGDTLQRCQALVALAFYEADWHWVQELNLALLLDEHEALEVRGLAATCLGHVARIHQKLDKNRVIGILNTFLPHPDLGGRVEDALSDIRIFMP